MGTVLDVARYFDHTMTPRNLHCSTPISGRGELHRLEDLVSYIEAVKSQLQPEQSTELTFWSYPGEGYAVSISLPFEGLQVRTGAWHSEVSIAATNYKIVVLRNAKLLHETELGQKNEDKKSEPAAAERLILPQFVLRRTLDGLRDAFYELLTTTPAAAPLGKTA